MRRRDRRARLAGAVVALVLGTGLVVTQAVAALVAAVDTGDVGDIELVDDDAAVALFSATGLAPGAPVAACIAVGYRSGGPVALRLHGRSEEGTLGPRLRLTVEAGDGGRFGNCAAFTGTAVYRGTLADFAARHRDFTSGLPVATGAPEEDLAFRFTVEVLDDNTAQGSEAVADFTWEARQAPPELPTTTTTTTTTAPDGPITTTTTTTSTTTVAGTTPPAPTTTTLPTTMNVPAGPTVTAVTTPTSSPPAAVPTPTGGSSRTGRRAALTPRDDERSGSILSAIARGAVFVLKRAAFPGVLLVIAGLFLLVQDSIDRRDPKLALAPIHPDPDLRFEQ
jgi:hypothetical protein